MTWFTIAIKSVLTCLCLMILLLSHKAYAYTYVEYIKAYNLCKNTADNLVECQRDAVARYECAKEENEDQCLLNYSRELYEQKLQDDAEREAELKAERARREVEEARRKAKEAAWSKKVEKRKAYGTGNWVVTKGDPDPIDDSKVVIAVLTADKGVARLGGKKVKLVIICRSRSTAVYIDWHDYVTDSTIVTHRFDKEKPISKRWPSSTDKTSSFYYGQGYEIAKKLMVVDQFVARTTPYNESPVTAIFDTRGLSMAIQPLRDACNW